MTAEQLLSWWNLIYILPLGMAVLYLVVYAASGLTFGDVDLPAEADADATAEADFDGHAEVEAHVEADADADTEAGHGGKGLGGHHADVGGGERTHELPLHWKVLSWFGLGGVPLSIVLMVVCLAWGTIGFVVNLLLEPIVPGRWMAVLVSLPAAFVGTCAATGGVVRFMERYLPTTETSARPRAKLVGTSGEALYDIDEKFGLAAVRTPEGERYQVPCRVYEGRAGVAKGKQVLLVDYDARQEFFYVTEYDLEQR